MLVRELVERFEQFAPQGWAEPGDPVGLQLGSLDAPVHRVLVTLDVRPEVVDEAIAVGADFIFAHHPMMFHPAKNLDLAVPQNQMYATLLQHHITVYGAHTNLDSAPNGMNDWLAAALGLQHTTGLVPSNGATATPDIMMGRVGDLKKPTTVQAFALRCKTIFHVGGLRLISHTPDASVRRVAVLGGSGGPFYQAALAQHADVYVTGDISYHPGHDMIAAGLNVIDPGHHIESICQPQLTHLFQQWAQENDWPITVQATTLNTDPFTFL
ncbi:MAG: Nif3-like dinuclear metal center hexameric protein [Levilactobacillus sp.]|uniref:Nif3-like dinuclear metal center hexameric protein n=1 Tax=Levilactobacillus sp. TaxID=2767919 RepID=UPI00258A8E64|nr:Nif3-like dinuclear metal center hexameric protein [Levilactobacillus sp.]MCH4123292.1 Nif3-like dinuclear metal center hexameric protein [Levilactobacillus sp.]MCI1552570.1 Nif3-like dinuclear metal center hexameric protein [Levilactobacillus sp.]MCI1599305.1 Nif3-like dinuclear metal center hexameric protein [Levilactobacillus sp.]MCI1606949.1 Nif3-like dinuclear metal center hexameric protein [Levilactobacillus sp.]